jgi:hypothetical protein
MPQVADYSVIVDNAFEVANGVAPGFGQTFDFDLPAGANLASRSILAYRARPLGAGETSWRIIINQVEVGTTALEAGPAHTMHQVVPGERLRAGANTISFVAAGPMRFNYVVLWWQHNLPDQVFQPG